MRGPEGREGGRDQQTVEPREKKLSKKRSIRNRCEESPEVINR